MQFVNNGKGGITIYSSPRSAQNIETAGVQKGCSRICTANCTLFSAYFAIFQDIATNLSCKIYTLISCVEGVVIK